MQIFGYFIVAIISFLVGLITTKKVLVTQIEKTNPEVLREEKEVKNNIEKLKQEEKFYLELLKAHDSDLCRKREEDNKMLEEYREEKRQLINQQIESEFELSREKLKQNIAEIAQLENSRLEESLQKNREDFEAKSKEFNSQLENCKNELEQLQLMRAAAIADAKRQEEMKTQNAFYRLQLTQADLVDILELKVVEKKLSKKEVLNKLIYKVYFEKPYTDLVGRVVGKEPKTGIYKITNIINQKVYIGQAVNIAERWKQHIKRALGAEPITQNKLYPAMMEEGVWNFTFEIVEVCEKSQLNEREQYWQKFFGAKEYGYSIK